VLPGRVSQGGGVLQTRLSSPLHQSEGIATEYLFLKRISAMLCIKICPEWFTVHRRLCATKGLIHKTRGFSNDANARIGGFFAVKTSIFPAFFQLINQGL
jgi:hypothetical protein